MVRRCPSPNVDARRIGIRTDGDTVWLTQQQMAQLFGRTVPTINRHIKAALAEELDGIPTSANCALVQKEGSRTVEREVEHYNLDMILSVGYRVKSKQGIYFHRWASSVLKPRRSSARGGQRPRRHDAHGRTLRPERERCHGRTCRELHRVGRRNRAYSSPRCARRYSRM